MASRVTKAQRRFMEDMEAEFPTNIDLAAMGNGAKQHLVAVAPVAAPVVESVTVPMTDEEKGDASQWSIFPGNPTALYVVSYKSGNKYCVNYSRTLNRVLCSCPAKGDCWHKRAFILLWLPLFKAEEVAPSLSPPVVTTAKPVAPIASYVATGSHICSRDDF